MPLTDIKVKMPVLRETRQTHRRTGLYLLVHPNGSKYWQLAYRFSGKQKFSPSASTLLLLFQKPVKT